MHHEIFEVLDDTGIGLAAHSGSVSERERRLVEGAANFHALAQPGRTLRFTVLRSPRGELPSLTDEDCRLIEWKQDREVVGSVLIRSTVRTTADSAAGAPIANGIRELTIDVGGEAGTASAYDELPGVAGKLRRSLRFRAPVHFDALRQLRTDVTEARYRTGVVPRYGRIGLDRGAMVPGTGGRPAVLFGVHWLELGGAERWALRTIELARAAGMVPVVVTDSPSTHPWITRPELDGAVVVPLTLPVDPEFEASFLAGVLSAFDVRGVHLHHCNWLYARLPWLSVLRPDVPVADSLHIVEWRTGGFVDVSVRMSNVIDIHHVISPQLRDYLIGKQRIEPDKVAMATLADLSADDRVPRARPPGARDPFTVAFVGRFTQQKRPYLFLKLASQLARTARMPMRFVMHGEGELAAEVRALRGRLGLADRLELRGTDRAVADTLAEADALVVSSDNEGLTLTTFEATRAGVPVISTDVGSQASLVASGLLCPRHPYPFLREASRRVLAIAESAEQRKIFLDEQLAKADRFATLPDAVSWTTQLYEGWAP